MDLENLPEWTFDRKRISTISAIALTLISTLTLAKKTNSKTGSDLGHPEPPIGGGAALLGAPNYAK